MCAIGRSRDTRSTESIILSMRSRIPALLLLTALVGVTGLPSRSAADDGGKGSDIGGPRDQVARTRRRFGLDPAELTDAEKAGRLATIEKEYEDLKRNQDVIQVRTRRNRVTFAGEMRYPPAGKFLRRVLIEDRDLRTRVAALVAIGRSGDFETIQEATKAAIAAARKESVFVLSIPRMYAECRHEEAGKFLLSRLTSVKDEASVAAVVEGIGATREPTAAAALEDLATKSKYVTVRFEALRALGGCGGKDVVSALLPSLADEDWRIRMAAAEGLGRTGERAVIPQLAELLVEKETPIVVETAAEAIGALGGADAVEPLIQVLRVGRLRARNKARLLLSAIARDEFRQRKDYFTDPEAWTSWWKKVKNPGTGVGQTPTAAPGESETISYFGFKIHSDKVLFILDVSGSMKWPDAPQGSGIKPADWDLRRIDLAHREMFRTLRQLRPETQFNVATFAGVVTPWKKDEVSATKENVEGAIAWLNEQLPRGGTATFDALSYGIDQTDVDTIYFLSDGVPSLGRFVEPETILAELRRANRFRRVSINTIALIVGKSPIESVLKYEDPEDMADFMGRIASENFGAFADESKP